MATAITSDNFEEYFRNALRTYGASVDNSDEMPDVPVVTQLELTTTMPLVKRDGYGQAQGYEQISIRDLLTQMAANVDPSAVLESSSVIDGARYNSTYNRIELTHGNTIVAMIDCSQIFNSLNYYTKSQTNALLNEKLDEVSEQQFNAIFK